MPFTDRLKDRELIPYEVMSGRRGQCQVFRVRKNTEACWRERSFPDGTYVYRESWEDREGFAILMDDYQTTLRHRIDPNIQLTERQWFTIMYGIVDRLAPPHHENIPHGDLCPSNILINLTPECDYDHKKIHITDFGIAFVTCLANSTGGYTTASGCVEYMAPEVYLHKKIEPTTMSDMWTVGIIGYEMCLGEEVTWTTESFQEIKKYMLAGQPLDLWRIPQRFGQKVREIIQTCMARDPTQRFTAADLRSFIKTNFVIMNADASNAAQNFSFMNSDWR